MYSDMMTAMADARAQPTEVLISEAQRGNRAAADRLVREHEGWVRSVIFAVSGRADLVDDIAQQVWMQVWERLDSLKEPQRLRSWLYSIARFAAIDAGIARRRRQNAVGELDAYADAPDRRSSAQPADVVSRSELHETLLQAVQALPAIYREPFVLRHLEDWSYAEIGEVLDMPVESVETRLSRARRMLREMLAGKV